MDIDAICKMTKSPTMLNALHACRSGHPLSVPGVNHFRNACFLAGGSRDINFTAYRWLEDQAQLFSEQPTMTQRILSTERSERMERGD